MNDEILSADYAGAVAQYGDNMLFIGWDFGDGRLQITVYPGYRFPSDDRVHGHIGIFDAEIDTPWKAILARVDEIEAEALQNYQRCMRFRTTRRSGRVMAEENGAEHVADAFRESWAGFALRLAREGQITRRDVVFRGDPARAFLADWRAHTYTVRVYDSGSLLVVPGDRTAEIP